MIYPGLKIFGVIPFKLTAAILLFTLLLSPASYAAEQIMPRTNLEILDSLAIESVGQFCANLNEMELDSAAITIAPHPAKEFLLNKILQKCSVHFFIADSLNALPAVEVIIDDYSAAYNLHPSDNDSLIREISVSFSSFVKNKFGRLEALPTVANSFLDTISREDIDFIINPAYNFANPPVPQPKRNFFEEVAEPFIIVGTAAIIVILLFTIRSE